MVVRAVEIHEDDRAPFFSCPMRFNASRDPSGDQQTMTVVPGSKWVGILRRLLAVDVHDEELGVPDLVHGPDLDVGDTPAIGRDLEDGEAVVVRGALGQDTGPGAVGVDQRQPAAMLAARRRGSASRARSRRREAVQDEVALGDRQSLRPEPSALTRQVPNSAPVLGSVHVPITTCRPPLTQKGSPFCSKIRRGRLLGPSCRRPRCRSMPGELRSPKLE